MVFRLLIVDDEVWMREGLRSVIEQLENQDFCVYGTARDGQDALKLMAEKEFDAVLTDIRMPGMDGLEFLRQLKDRGVWTPVVIITGHNEFEYARTAFRLGAVDYLLKPINKVEIAHVLSNLKEQLVRVQELNPNPAAEAEAWASSGSQGTAFVDMLVARMKEHYAQDMSISLLAEEAGFNSSYISRLFKAETGKGFVQYLTEIRMSKAVELLKGSRLTIAEVSRMVGFWDERHFSRTFKREIGYSPAEFRKLAIDM